MVNSFDPCTYVSDGEEKAAKFLCDFHFLLDPDMNHHVIRIVFLG
jgi:hypothetical protein